MASLCGASYAISTRIYPSPYATAHLALSEVSAASSHTTHGLLKSLSSPFICSNSGHSLSDKKRHYLLFWLFNKAPLSRLAMARAGRWQMMWSMGFVSYKHALCWLASPTYYLPSTWSELGNITLMVAFDPISYDDWWYICLTVVGQLSCSTQRPKPDKVKLRWFLDKVEVILRQQDSKTARQGDGFETASKKEVWAIGTYMASLRRSRHKIGRSWSI